MIKIHFTFLFTEKIHKVMIITALIIGAVLYTLSEYKTAQPELLFFEEYYVFEFVQQGITIIKFMILLFISLSWIYATKISNYRVYVCTRYHPLKVFLTQYIVLIGMTLLFMIPLISLFVFIWLLYPGMLHSQIVISLFLYLSLWIVIYHTLCWLMEVLFHHIFALVIPLLGYFFGMVSMGIISDSKELETSPLFIQLLFPDILYIDKHFTFVFSPFVHLSILLLCVLIIYKILQKKDYNTYL